jgi:RND family efflux transporter MFP subunit
VTRVSVHEGQKVSAGDVIATVDEAVPQEAMRQAEAGRVQAVAAEANANSTLDRTKALVARGIAATQELDDANARAQAAHAASAAASASLDLARKTLGRVVLRSSFDGTVTRIWRGDGSLVDGTAATPILELAASGGREFVADATESELVLIRGGQAAHAVLSADGSELDGVVLARSSALDSATGLGTVRIGLGASPADVPIGSYGRVIIHTRRRQGVSILPAAALRGAVADGAEVVVCKSGKAEVRELKVGWRDEQRFEVVSGLKPDERVAVDHVLGLESDTQLRQLP